MKSSSSNRSLEAKGKKFIRKARRHIGAAWKEMVEMRLVLNRLAQREKAPSR